jgi:DMSO/TMAO reductase YedYZ heme-binding membrane subunit
LLEPICKLKKLSLRHNGGVQKVLGIINSVLINIHLVNYLELSLLIKFINISWTSMLIFNEISCTIKWDEANFSF